MLNHTFLRQSKGFTLIEILLVVGFIILGSIGGYVLYNKISENRAITNENINVQRIIQETKTVLKSNNNTKITLKFLSDYGIVERDKVINDNYQSYLNSQVAFSTLTSGSKTTHLRMVYQNMNVEYCGKIIPLFSRDADFIAVNNQILKNHLDPDNLKDYVMADALQACALAGENFNVIVVFPLTNI